MTCSHCGSIGPKRTITTEYDAGNNLVESGSSYEFPVLEQIDTHVRRCQLCLASFLWELDIDSIQGGPEHYQHETLERVEEHEARERMAQDRAFLTSKS
jgi:hypothetical protein